MEESERKKVSLKKAYDIILKELKHEKKFWDSAEITLWTPETSGARSGLSFEIKNVRLGRIEKADAPLDTEECLILEQVDAPITYFLYGDIYLLSSLKKGQFLEFENDNWFYVTHEQTGKERMNTGIERRYQFNH